MKPPEIIFASKAMELVIDTSRRIARTLTPVLIEGESGTGKELIAKLIHSLSDRRLRPFVPVNCGAVPETLFESEFFGYKAGAFTGAVRDKPGIFEAANGGTLFLDEIGDLSPAMQAKCLRVLQENELRRVGETKVSIVDVRFVSATNKKLEEEMRTRRFREDLFFRISVLRLSLEPLRERKEDIPVLCDHFSAKHALRLGKEAPDLSDAVMSLFSDYEWPGNVRELENEIHRMVALSNDGTPVTCVEVSPRILNSVKRAGEPGSGGGLKARLEACEKEIIQDALATCGWNKSRTARHLGLSRQGLHRKLQRLGIRRYE
ncbi:MAG: sigma-54 dependent transcriptional regulator [Candidatus Eisenbacteria bacterium]